MIISIYVKLSRKYLIFVKVILNFNFTSYLKILRIIFTLTISLNFLVLLPLCIKM